MEAMKFVGKMLCPCCGSIRPTSVMRKMPDDSWKCPSCVEGHEVSDEERNEFAEQPKSAEIIDFKKSAQEILARRELARRRLLPFVCEFKPGYQAGWVHKDICRRLEKFSAAVAAKQSPRLMLFMPPRSGKSELVSRSFPAWHLGKYPTDEIIACSYAASLANGFSRKVREILRDPDYHKIFDTRLDKSSQAIEQWLTSAGGGYVAAGVGGPIVGKGANVLIIDDPTKGRDEAQSDAIKESVRDWYTGSAYTRLAPGGGILVVMQRWAEDDLAGWLEAEDKVNQTENWEIVRYPAIAVTDEEFRNKGEALHPERYDLAALNRIRTAIGERDFAALYQQNPIPDEGDYFKKEQFRFYSLNTMPDVTKLRLFCTFDLAIGQKERNDFTAGLVAGVDEESNIFILHVYHGRWDSLSIAKMLFEIWQVWEPELIGLEKGHIEGTMRPFLDKMSEDLKIFPFFEPLTVGRKDKEARAQAIRGWMSHGKVYWNKQDPNQHEFIEEMLKFPNGKHDDRVDCIAHLGQLLQKLIGGQLETTTFTGKKSWREEFERKIALEGYTGLSHMAS